MHLPLDITIRDIENKNSEAIETQIRKKADKLMQFSDRILHARVTIDCPQKHKHRGKLFRVVIEIDVPGKTLIANKHKNEDLYVAIRDAFDAIKRQLEDFTRIRRGSTKTHQLPKIGEVIRLFPDYGFIATPDGNEYYFHETHVLQPSFAELIIGMRVHFLESVGGDGLQASKVSAI